MIGRGLSRTSPNLSVNQTRTGPYRTEQKLLSTNTGIDTLSSNTGFVQNLNPTVNATAGFAAFNVDISTTSIGASVPDSAQYSVFATYTYEVQGGVPEPSTLALVGGVLVLAGIRKFRS